MGVNYKLLNHSKQIVTKGIQNIANVFKRVERWGKIILFLKKLVQIS